MEAEEGLVEEEEEEEEGDSVSTARPASTPTEEECKNLRSLKISPEDTKEEVRRKYGEEIFFLS